MAALAARRRKLALAWLTLGLLGFSRSATAQSAVDFPPYDGSTVLPVQPGPTPTLPAARRSAGYRDHPFHFELIFGADTRVGELGMALEYAIGDALSLGIGVGTNGFGAEWAANARLRPVWWRIANGSFFQALTLEGSVSRATQTSGTIVSYGCDDNCIDADVLPQTVYWSQGELGWEGMLRNGFTFRASSGIASAIGSRRWQCESATTPHCEAPARQLFVQTFALGVAF